MKIKALVVLLTLCVSVAFAGALYAQEEVGGWGAPMTAEFAKKIGVAKYQHFDGPVASHDVACHCFVIKDAKKGNLILQDDYAKFHQEYDKVKGLKIGEKATGTYKTIDAINYATEVHQK